SPSPLCRAVRKVTATAAPKDVDGRGSLCHERICPGACFRRRKGESMQASPQFKTIPGHDEIQRLERDLRFHPSTVQNPQALTPKQVQAFNREGFIKGLRA